METDKNNRDTKKEARKRLSHLFRCRPGDPVDSHLWVTDTDTGDQHCAICHDGD